MKQRIRLTESDLRKIVKESVKKVLKETSAFSTESHIEATYFQIMRLRLSSLSNWKENPEISSRARQILDDIKQSNMTPWECIETYWDETQEMIRQLQRWENKI